MSESIAPPEDRNQNLVGVFVFTGFGLEPFNADFDDRGNLADQTLFVPGTIFAAVTEVELDSFYSGNQGAVEVKNEEEGFKIVFVELGGYAVSSQTMPQPELTE